VLFFGGGGLESTTFCEIKNLEKKKRKKKSVCSLRCIDFLPQNLLNLQGEKKRVENIISH
jgi:hypothetical protein